MVMKKVTLSAFLLACPWLAFANGQQQQQQHTPRGDAAKTIAELNRICLDKRADAQVKDFRLGFECGGKYSYWDNGSSGYALPKDAYMTAHTTTKDHRFETSPGEFRRDLVDHTGRCTQYFQKEMSAPASIQVFTDDCDDINVAHIQAVCESEVHDYCDNNFVTEEELAFAGRTQQQQQQQQQQSTDGSGMCVLRTVDTINTCENYK